MLLFKSLAQTCEKQRSHNAPYFFFFHLKRDRQLSKSFLMMNPKPCVLREFRVKYRSLVLLYTCMLRLPLGIIW